MELTLDLEILAARRDAHLTSLQPLVWKRPVLLSFILQSLHHTEKIMLQAMVLVIQTWEAIKYTGIFMSNL